MNSISIFLNAIRNNTWVPVHLRSVHIKICQLSMNCLKNSWNICKSKKSFTTEKTWWHVWVKEVKGREGKNINWLLNGTSALVTQGKKEGEVLNITFISVFTSKTGPEKSKTLEGWQWGEMNLFCFYWFLQLTQSAGLYIIPICQKKTQAISPHPSQDTKLQFEKKSCSPQFLESFLKLSVTLNCLLVSVSNSKSMKADISITHNNDDSSCKSE